MSILYCKNTSTVSRLCQVILPLSKLVSSHLGYLNSQNFKSDMDKIEWVSRPAKPGCVRNTVWNLDVLRCAGREPQMERTTGVQENDNARLGNTK